MTMGNKDVHVANVADRKKDREGLSQVDCEPQEPTHCVENTVTMSTDRHNSQGEGVQITQKHTSSQNLTAHMRTSYLANKIFDTHASTIYPYTTEVGSRLNGEP